MPALAELAGGDALQQSSESGLTLDLDSLEFVAFDDTPPDPQAFTLSSSDESTIDWEASVFTDDGEGWLTLSAESGQVSDTPVIVDVGVDPTGLVEGLYFASIYVEDVNALFELEISVVLEIGNMDEPILTVDPYRLTFQVAEGGANPAGQSFMVSNEGSVAFDYTVIPLDDWVQVDSESGSATQDAPGTVNVTVDASGFTSGVYSTEIDIVDTETYYYETILIDLIVTGDAALQASPASMNFTVVEGQNSSETQTLTVTNGGAGDLEWYAYNDQAWLVLEYSEDDDSQLTVGLFSEWLDAGVYTDTIYFESNGGFKEIPVTLSVQSAAQANMTQPAPNLAITDFRIEPANPTAGAPAVFVATITNNGAIATTNAGFYVDLFFNPSQQPRGGVDWYAIDSSLNPKQGIEWGVFTGSLAPGQSITMRSDGANGALAPDDQYTNYDGNFPANVTDVVLYVDSWEQNGSPNGALLESNEADNLAKITINGGAPPAPPTGNLEIFGLEVTQAIQDLKNSVPLVSNKQTYVRAHVRSLGTAIPGVQARLIGTRNGQALPGSPLTPVNDPLAITVLPTPNRAVKNESFLFKLPATWIGDGNLTLEFQGSNQQFQCAELGEDAAARDCKVTVTFESVPNIPLRYYDIQWTDAQGTHSLTQGVQDRNTRALMAQFPVSGINFQPTQPLRVTGNPTSAGGTSTFLERVLDQINVLHRQDPSYVYYYGLAADTAGNGWGYTPRDTDYGFFTGDGSAEFPGITVHELAHMHGRQHTNCSGAEAAPDGNYPHPGGRISTQTETLNPDTFFGFNIYTQQIYPPTVGDVLSYCPQTWVSGYNYKLILDAIKRRQKAWDDRQNNPLFQAAALDEPQDVLIVHGAVGDDDNVTIGGVVSTEAPATLGLPEPGDYVLQVQDAVGAAIASYPFATGRAMNQNEVFNVAVPRTDNIRRVVVLKDGVVLDQVAASANAPEITLNSPNGGETFGRTSIQVDWTASDADGDDLTVNIEYSTDDGATWSVISTDLTGNSAELDLSKVAGSDQARLRVRASDGFNGATDQSDGSFSVPNAAPDATIATASGQRFVRNQAIVLDGSGVDLEDGAITGSGLTWRSTRNGQLGNGERLELDAFMLKEGKHTITLSARDSAGATAVASINLIVTRNPVVIPAVLNLYPAEVGAVVEFDATNKTVTENVRVANDGDSNLQWTAVAQDDWVKIDKSNGAAPEDVKVTVDATGFEPGYYASAVVFKNSRTDEETTLTVKLLVNKAASDPGGHGTTIFLPLITR